MLSAVSHTRQAARGWLIAFGWRCRFLLVCARLMVIDLARNVLAKAP